jgi:hypothetical protein
MPAQMNTSPKSSPSDTPSAVAAMIPAKAVVPE